MIEASAGTGKTTALENLMLRLLIEGVVQPDGSLRQLEISEILLVTFTEAATAELIQRVRKKILNSLKLYENDKKITLILRMALLNFDKNAIFTIHGFCRKMLNNFTFESNSRFNLELINDDRAFLDEVVNDYWRMKFYNINDELEEKIIKAYKWEPKILHKLLRSIQSAPLTKIIKPDNQGLLQDSYAEFEKYCLANKKLLYTLKEKINNFKGTLKKELDNALDCFISFEDIFGLIKVLNRKLLEKNITKRPKPVWDIFEDSVPARRKTAERFR